MGWDFAMQPATSKEIVAYVTRPWTENGHSFYVTNIVWGAPGELWGIIHRDNKPVEINLWLIKRRKDSWGYKSLPECVEPYYYSCPLRLLDIASETSAEWRKGVREYHRKQALAKSLKVGDKVKLVDNLGKGCGGAVVQIIGFKGKTPLGYIGGTRYKLPARVIAEKA